MHDKLFYRCFVSSLIVVIIAGCDRSPDSVEHPDLPGHSLSIDGNVKFDGRVLWNANSGSLATNIWAENIGDEPAEINTGPCSFNILAYTLSEDENKLIWNNDIPDSYICPDEMLVYTIPTNESVQLDGLMYISGNEWKYDLPKGEWQFFLEAKSDNGGTISVPVKKVVID